MKIQRLIAGVIAFIMLSLMAVPAFATGIEIDSSPSDAEIFAHVISRADEMTDNQIGYSAKAIHKIKKFGSTGSKYHAEGAGI